MPSFIPRNRVEILREMVARVVSRSKLIGLTKNSVVYHVLAAAANEDAEQYLQAARLRAQFSLDTATGSDLDARAAEIVPDIISRRGAIYATGQVVFTRPGTVGTVVIPIGTQVSAANAAGTIRFRTTSAGSIPNLSSSSAPVGIVATEAGIKGNVAAGSITKMVSRIAGVTGVTNTSKLTNGFDRESDASFVSRKKAFVQASSRGTPRAIEAFARQVVLSDGRRVVFAHIVEQAIPNGTTTLYIDDGTGSVETYDSQFVSSFDTILASASGREKNLYTTNRPIRDDGSFALQINGVVQTRHLDYELNASVGQVELSTASYPTGLPAAAVVTANYRSYTGLIQETQRVIDGDPSVPLTYPGVRAAGIQVRVQAADVVYQSIVGSISVSTDFDPAVVVSNVVAALQDYINTLDIGDDVILAEIIQRAMDVDGMINIKITSLSGSNPPVDQVVLSNQAARIISSSITLT